jgi:hypothetical protein
MNYSRKKFYETGPWPSLQEQKKDKEQKINKVTMKYSYRLILMIKLSIMEDWDRGSSTVVGYFLNHFWEKI